MAVREIVQVGNPILHKPCDPVDLSDPMVRIIANDLHDTYKHLAITRWGSGLMTGGIAANQLGYNARMIILATGRIYPCQREVIVNPRLIPPYPSQKFDFWSGCGSVPNLWACVESYRKLSIEGVRCDGTEILLHYFGTSAGMAQHEMNHLDGKTIVDLAKKSFPSYEEFERLYKPIP